ncbi:hypothetical protein D5H78_00870 [Vallicoccus soli]|uniref:Uncharacterized protein n=1 Tax=Vallicoccus soli TaxID=2339232 RepID=A0A3A3Z239_9ACTN|nr:hypothetical protein D5H78_00870 [Vallicoccus soli]
MRLQRGQVTVLLGPEGARDRVRSALDPRAARCAGGHAVRGVLRVEPAPGEPAAARVAALDEACRERVPVLLAVRPSAGLAAAERRDVLAAVRRVAATGAAVLLDDADPVAALAVADAALRCGDDGSLAHDDLAVPALAAP